MKAQDTQVVDIIIEYNIRGRKYLYLMIAKDNRAVSSWWWKAQRLGHLGKNLHLGAKKKKKKRHCEKPMKDKGFSNVI